MQNNNIYWELEEKEKQLKLDDGLLYLLIIYALTSFSLAK